MRNNISHMDLKMKNGDKEKKYEKMVDIGLMKAGSVFGCRTFYGYKLDIVKSGIQKYLRRRKLEKMIWNVVEMDLFSRLDRLSIYCLNHAP